jgi:hypothetical protein
MRSSPVLLLDALKVLFNEKLIFRDLYTPNWRLRLYKLGFAATTGVSGGINRFGVSFEFIAAFYAFPNVLVVDSVRVFCCHFNTTVTESYGTFLCPVILLIP